MKIVKVSIPSQFINSNKVYIYLTSLYNSFNNKSNYKIYINCIYLLSIDSAMIAPLGLILTHFKNNGNLIYFSKLSYSNRQRLIKSRFLKKFSDNDDINAFSETFISYTSFNADNYEAFKKYLSTNLSVINDEDIINTLVTCLSELFENVNMHARSHEQIYGNDEIFSSGYYTSDEDYVLFSLCNNGISFRENIEPARSLNFSYDYEYILWALKPRHSTRKGNTPGGIGLTVLLDLIKHSKGILTIVSGKGYINFDYELNKFIKSDFSLPFPGTVITFKIPLNDLKIYLNSIYHCTNNQDILSVSDLLSDINFNKNQKSIIDLLKENLLKEVL